MIHFNLVTFQYPETLAPALRQLSLAVDETAFTAVVGHNGSGKSTLAKLINGLLLPTDGTVVVDGLDTRDENTLLDIRRNVGMVFQNPDNQFVTTIVEEDVAFGPENLGVPTAEIRRRVDAALETVGLCDFARHAAHKLSGGQKQRVAVAGMLAMHPRLLVLDEASAMLDPRGRQELLQTAHTLHKNGMGILMITQYMEETVECDRVIALRNGTVAFDGSPEDFFRDGDFVRAIGLETPEAVYIRDELRKAGIALPQNALTLETVSDRLSQILSASADFDRAESGEDVCEEARHNKAEREMKISLSQLCHTYTTGANEPVHAVSDVSLTVAEGEFVGIIGQTGSGKTTLVQHFNGLLAPTSGSVKVGEFDLSDKKSRRQSRRYVGMVFQYPEYQLFAETVLADVKFGLKNEKLAPDEENRRAAAALASVGLDPEKFAGKSPFDLSGGEKRRAALAGVLVMRPRFLILDEPMAGLDPAGRKEILGVLEALRKDTGCAIIMISHSMDDIARFATRILVMDKGRLAMDGTPQEVFARESELTQMGLALPYSAALCRMLRQKGIAAPANICTTRVLLAWLKGVLSHA